ncbi:alginate lyase family protein [Haloarcula litorea]|uniref:alginate lyase family protein n=1 Tax=Haloarcula litorea TaxID=3032579 RepID=UPI0023E85CDD|nr:alginate lyase family protein [Halomicroarcula sp. GDY20]
MCEKKLRLYGHTLARMEHAQIAGMGKRKFRESLLSRLPIALDSRYELDVPSAPVVDLDPFEFDLRQIRSSLSSDTRERFRERARRAAAGDLEFIGRTIRVQPAEAIDWFDTRFDDVPALWRLKLYAFEPLKWAVLGFEGPGEAPPGVVKTFDAWLDDWIATTHIGEPGYLRKTWTPWAVSLRIQIWARYAAWKEGAEAEESTTGSYDTLRPLLEELFKNALFLSDNVEWGVGGNHLIENGAALLSAGVLFPNSGQDFLDQGKDVLSRTTERQLLADGCHFERSPMYHAIVTERLLASRTLLAASNRPVPDWLRDASRRTTAFLQAIHPPDDRIPLFNDAVFEQALPLDACLNYASAVGVPVTDVRLECKEVPETSGYCWLDTRSGRMLVDGGAVGPPHLPGHSHNDLFSFVLWVGGQRTITDTGAYSYAAGNRRQYARGVEGHNTVQVGTSNPIEIGGRYLMGARTDPDVDVRYGEVDVFEGYYETARRAPADYWHRRFFIAGDDWWLVWDRVGGPDTETTPVTSRLHFHPDVSVTGDISDGRIEVPIENTAESAPRSLRLRAVAFDDTALENQEYYPRFGIAQERSTFALWADPTTDHPVSLGYLLTASDSGGGAELETEDGLPVAVETVDGQIEPLSDLPM